MVEINLHRKEGDFGFEATDANGHVVRLDTSDETGGVNYGVRPMQMLLMGLGGCSAIDIVMILKKQRQPLHDIKITVTGEREADAVPSLFKKAHVHFQLFGPLHADKAEKAVSLSVEKYCSVAKTLEPTATVSYSFEIIK
ncbi:MAG: OsmC family protein [Bacteroidia bacterium]|nr:OsmC family protein [Bacteroidia bacterium]